MVDITGPIMATWNEVLTFIPVLIAAIIILIIGWIVGRIVGGVIKKILQRAHLDDTMHDTDFGKSLAKSNMTASGLIGSLVKWFIYIIFIMAAVNVLNIPLFADFLNAVVLYLPNLIAGFLVLIIGLIAINFVMKWIKSILSDQGVPFTHWIVVGIQILLSIVIIVIALDQWRIQTEIIYTFLVPLAWGIAIGVAIALGIGIGWGGKDAIGEYVRKTLEAGESKVKEKTESEKAGKEEFHETGEGISPPKEGPEGKFKKL